MERIILQGQLQTENRYRQHFFEDICDMMGDLSRGSPLNPYQRRQIIIHVQYYQRSGRELLMRMALENLFRAANLPFNFQFEIVGIEELAQALGIIRINVTVPNFGPGIAGNIGTGTMGQVNQGLGVTGVTGFRNTQPQLGSAPSGITTGNNFNVAFNQGIGQQGLGATGGLAGTSSYGQPVVGVPPPQLAQDITAAGQENAHSSGSGGQAYPQQTGPVPPPSTFLDQQLQDDFDFLFNDDNLAGDDAGTGPAYQYEDEVEGEAEGEGEGEDGSEDEDEDQDPSDPDSCTTTPATKRQKKADKPANPWVFVCDRCGAAKRERRDFTAHQRHGAQRDGFTLDTSVSLNPPTWTGKGDNDTVFRGTMLHAPETADLPKPTNQICMNNLREWQAARERDGHRPKTVQAKEAKKAKGAAASPDP
ncbi:hypothetical protein A1O1_06439 [Capronia coronata CBS 617.96]|uniref:Uncharacterized protein n=1 Tax=Capronia coronata CBS 617.96 TaxID=1182541 RepID=W9Y8W1_9EURO|nr:uncharacterized protein A1O1_06439 [Capronia coronata CBS 617.96]EXJ86070.1 hypothetical protein A1O1_06439 [Capronia coronata CBS 617.96]